MKKNNEKGVQACYNKPFTGLVIAKQIFRANDLTGFYYIKLLTIFFQT